MDSRMKEACLSNRPAVVRRCSDDKKRGAQAFGGEEPGSSVDRAECHMQGSG